MGILGKTNIRVIKLVTASFFAFAFIFLFFGNHQAFAATYTVTPSSACTLPDAITAADTDAIVGSCAAGGTSNTINLASGIYTLTANLPTITNHDLTVNGAGPEQTIIDGSNTYSMFDIETSGLASVFSNFTTIGVGGTNSTWYSIDDAQGNGTLNVSNVVFRDSTVGGGLLIGEPGSITNSAIENVRGPNGGEIFFDSFGSGTFNIINTTIANSNFGSGIWVDVRSGGTINLINDTIANNTAPGAAGGIELWVTTEDPGTVVNLENTILDNNVNSGNVTVPANCSTTSIGEFGSALPASLGHNISSDDTCSAVLTQPGDMNSTDPGLGAFVLDDNTYVFPLSNTSAAYNAADASAAPATDQRGVNRPQCGAADIGAYELACQTTIPLVLADETTAGAPNTGFGVNNSDIAKTLIEYGLGAAAIFALSAVIRKLANRQ